MIKRKGLEQSSFHLALAALAGLRVLTLVRCPGRRVKSDLLYPRGTSQQAGVYILLDNIIYYNIMSAAKHVYENGFRTKSNGPAIRYTIKNERNITKVGKKK